MLCEAAQAHRFRFFKCCKQKHIHKRIDVSISNRKGPRRWPYHFQALVLPKRRFATIHCHIQKKTGTRQCGRAVWSTFAGIHSSYPPRFSTLFGVASLSERSDPQVTTLNNIIKVWVYWNFRLARTSQHTRDLSNLSHDRDI